MHPGFAPAHLGILSTLEESLLALHCPVLKVVRLKGGNFGYSGNCVAVTQDIGHFVTKLPRDLSSTHLSIIMPVHAGAYEEAPRSLRVSSSKIRNWLTFLIHSNPLYSDIVIDENALMALPEQGTTFSHLLPFICIAADDPENVGADSSELSIQGIVGDEDKVLEQDLVEKLLWPERSADAIREFCMPNLLAKCFPSIFPYGVGDPTSPSRNFKVSLSDGIAHLTKYAYYSEFQGRMVWPLGEHPIAPFYAFDVKTRQILLGQSGVFLRNRAESFPSSIDELRMQLQDASSKSSILTKIGRYAGNVPGTPGYWQSRKDELLNLCEQSPPHVWFTLSAADVFWWDLKQVLPPGSKPSSFPHLVDAYVSEKMDEYVKRIWGVRAEWTWYRLEYQSRGTVHLHGCVRLRNIPNLHGLYVAALTGRSNPLSKVMVDAGLAAEKEICDVADSLCSAWNPDPPADACSLKRDDRGDVPDPHPCSIFFDNDNLEKLRMQQTLNEVQRHRHVESYCMRKGVCRFGYPLPLSDITHFIWTPTSSGGQKGTLMYRRNDCWLNNHHCGFKSWNANMDVKVIYNLHCLAEYLCGYATKSESTSASVARTLAIAVTNPNVEGMVDPVKSAIRSAFIKGHSGRSISSQETAHLNLSLPLVCQPMIEYIRISLDSASGSRLLDIGDQGNLIVPNIMDCYRKRSNSELWVDEMAEWCVSDECNQISLQNFASCFFYCRTIGKLRARALTAKKRIIIPFPKIRASSTSKLYHKYCFLKLLLHHPWQHEHPWGENTSSVQVWESFAFSNSLSDFDAALMDIVPDEADNAVLSPEDDQREFANWNRLMCNREQGFQFENLDWHQNQTYDPNIKSALHDARKPDACHFPVDAANPEIILDDHQKHIVSAYCDNGGLCLMIGAGGFGKSQVCMAIKQKLGTLVAITAMTGKAGSLISGTTLHSFAHLPNKKKQKCALSPSILGRFQLALEGVTHLIVDEFTMMSQETLFFLDMRLKEGKACALPFGGIHILLVGDTAQLPPVQGLCLWAKPLKSTAIEAVGAALYAMFVTVFILKVNYRQRTVAGAELATFLVGMRGGKMTDADYDFLLSRSRERVGEVAWTAAAATAVHLYPTNDKVEEENSTKLRALSSDFNVPIAMIRAINSCSKAANASKKIAGGLDNLLCIGVGASVMLTQNLWTQYGLVNGAIGTIMDICGSDHVADILIVNIPSYSGPSLCAPHPRTWIPVPRSSSQWYSSGSTKERSQFPLTLAYAITIHKSQGSTFPAGTNLVIDIGERCVSILKMSNV